MKNGFRVEYLRQFSGYVTVDAEDENEAQTLVELRQGEPGDESPEELIIVSIKRTSDD